MDLSECVIVSIPARYVDPWLAMQDSRTAEDYDRTAAVALNPNDSINAATRAAILRAVEAEKAGKLRRVLGDEPPWV